MVNKDNHPQMALIQVGDILDISNPYRYIIQYIIHVVPSGKRFQKTMERSTIL